jgi:hypothetical protein
MREREVCILLAQKIVAGGKMALPLESAMTLKSSWIWMWMWMPKPKINTVLRIGMFQ